MIDLLYNLDSVTTELEKHRRTVVERLEQGFSRVPFPIADRESATVSSDSPEQSPVGREIVPAPLGPEVTGKIVFLRDRPRANPDDKKVDLVTQKFRSQRSGETLSVLFGPRGRPLGCRHAVLGNQTVGQQMTHESAALFLAVLGVLGEDFRAFFNGPTAASHPDILHCHYWADDLPILELATAKAWPAPVEVLPDVDLGRAATWMATKALPSADADVDYDFAFSVSRGRFTVVALRRLRGRRKPLRTLADNLGRDEAWYDNHFSTFGVLEMSGYLVGIRSEEGFHMLIDEPRLYGACLRELTAVSGGRLTGQ